MNPEAFGRGSPASRLAGSLFKALSRYYNRNGKPGVIETGDFVSNICAPEYQGGIRECAKGSSGELKDFWAMFTTTWSYHIHDNEVTFAETGLI